ncbi:MAG: leucine-rich repeat domain-containing protein [Spirochaetales bacterium]|nr:leucine-rich repeat domain-containing protein [Spirochaetales bacterium]
MKRKTQLSFTMSKVVFLLAVLLLSVSLVFVSCDLEPKEGDGTSDSSVPEDSGSGGDDESPDDPGDLVVPDEPGVVIPDEPGDSGDDEGDEEVIADENLFYVEECILKLKNSVVLPDKFTLPSQISGQSYTKLNNSIFSGIENIKSVTIPSGVLELGNEAFSWCSNLETVVIPDTVTTLGQKCFYKSTKLKEVSASGVTSVGTQAFDGCAGLESASLPSVGSLPSKVFNECAALETTVLTNVTTIGDSVFTDCTSIASIELPKMTGFTGYYAFKRCTNLEYVYLGTAVDGDAACSMPMNSETFNGCTNLKHIYVPSEKLESYLGRFEWSPYYDKIASVPTV